MDLSYDYYEEVPGIGTAVYVSYTGGREKSKGEYMKWHGYTEYTKYTRYTIYMGAVCRRGYERGRSDCSF